jgi:hypothetical protein
MKNLLFNLSNYFHNLFDKKIPISPHHLFDKKIPISPHLPLSRLNYFEKKTHPKKAKYKEVLLSLNTDNLWVAVNLNCFLNLFEEYQEKQIKILELG